MTYDDEKAKKKLQAAVEIALKCDPMVCDCEKCPIGKPMELVAHDSGVKIVASICSMLSALKEVCFEPKEYRYKRD